VTIDVIAQRLATTSYRLVLGLPTSAYPVVRAVRRIIEEPALTLVARID